MATLTAAILTAAIKPLAGEIYQLAKGSLKDGVKKISLSQSIKKISSQLALLDQVKTIWSPEEALSLQKFYYPSKVLIDGSPTKVSSLSELPEGNLVIEGIVGQGKSIFMRYIATSILSCKIISVIPILIELRRISSLRSLMQALLIALDNLGLPCDEESFELLANNGKLVLLLDGFDEVPGELVGDVIAELESLQAKYQSLKIIISSRPKSSIQNVTGFRVLPLIQLKSGDYAAFLARLITSTVKRHEIVRALKECSENISGVICTPLMLTLVVIVHQTEQEIPSTLPEFFDKLFNTVFSKHDRFKAGFNRQHNTGLSESELKKLFDAFCFMVVQSGGGRSISTRLFDLNFEKASKYTSATCGVDNFRRDIIKVACLMLEEGFDTITFLHKSILDYHAAAFIRALPDGTAKNFYYAAAKSHKTWRFQLEFLVDIDKIRYLKYYVLDNLPGQLKGVSDLIESGNDNELIKYLEAMQPEFHITTVDYEFAQAGPIHNKDVEFFNKVSDEPFEAIIDSIDFSLTEKMDCAIKLSQGPDSFPGEHQIFSVRAVINTFGSERVWKKLKSLEEETIRSINDAEKYLANEMTKSMFLEDLLFSND